MGARKQKKREQKSSIMIVGEGKTEQWYFDNIKKIFSFRCTVKPRFFGNTSIDSMRKKVEVLLQGDAFVICVFDLDVAGYNSSEHERLVRLLNMYKNNKNVLFCNSLPSIEYWFLLHYEQTNRHYRDSKAVEKALKKYIKDYEKTEKFLKNKKWVRDLCSNDKLENAIKYSKQLESKDESYTNLHEAFNVLRKNEK